MKEASGPFPMVVEDKGDYKLIIYSAQIDLVFSECRDGRYRWRADQFRTFPSKSRSSKRRYVTREALERALKRDRPHFWEPWP